MKCIVGTLAVVIIAMAHANNDNVQTDTAADAGERDLGNNRNKKNKNKKYKHYYPQPYWPKPVPKPTPQPVLHPSPQFIEPCYRLYDTQFPDGDDAAGTFIDLNANGNDDLGEQFIYSGDLFNKGNQYKVGFIQQVDTKVADINADSAFQTYGVISIKDFGQIAYTGYQRNKFSGTITNNFGPNSTFAITGGTKKFEHASGEIICRRRRVSATPEIFDLAITIYPKCLLYSGDYYINQWP